MTEFTMDDAVRTVMVLAALAVIIVGMKQEAEKNKIINETKTQYVQKQDSIINYQTQQQR